MAKVAKVVPGEIPQLENGSATDVTDGKPKEEKPKKAPLGKMFSLATTSELILLLVGVLGALGNGVMQPLVILMWGDMIDGLGAPESQGLNTTDTTATSASMDSMMDDVTTKCIHICLLGAGSVVLGTVQGFCFKRFAELMHHRMLQQYYYVVLHKDVEWFDKEDPASLPLQISGDSQAFGEAWGDKLGTSVMGLATFFAGYIFAYVRGWPIALCMTGTLPLIAVGGILMGAAMEDVMRETQSWYGKASAVAEETFYAMRTVVAFGAEFREIEKYSFAVSKARWGGVKNQIKIGAGLGYTMCMCFLSYALAFYFGMRLRYDSVENPSTGKVWKGGEILGVMFCVLMGSFMIGTIDPGVKAFDAARVSAARFFTARDVLPVIQCRTQDTRKPLAVIEKLELQDVHFAYPGSPDLKVLNGLSLSIKQGQKVAVVGESGSGKSTVMALLERFYDPQSGKVLVNGEDIQSFSISTLRKCIGYVGQEPVLFATSIRENILQGTTEADQKQLLEKVISDAQLGFVDQLPEKLDTYVGSGGLQMSGGQKQRIAIARALIKQAAVLFFDEATSALDNVSEKMIQETIDKLSTSSSSSLTIVTIAHRLSTVRGSDVIYVLSKGTLAESGTHTELIAKTGLYHALVASQDAAIESGPEEVASSSQSGLSNKSPSSSKALRTANSMVDKKLGATSAERDAEDEEREKQIAKTYKVPMMRLLGFCKKEWALFLPGSISACYDGASQPLTGLLIVEAMTAFMMPKEEMRKKMEEVTLYFLILAIGEFFACTTSCACFGMLGESLTMRLRTSLFSKVFEQEIGFHDDPDNSPGTLGAALQIYAFRVSNLCKTIGNKVNMMFCLLIGLTIGFIACWQIALILLCSVPITIVANMLQMVVLLGGGAKENEKLKRAQQLVSESVQNVRTVHATGIEKRLAALYSGVVVSARTPVAKHVLAGLALGVSGGVMFFIMGAAFFFMAEFLKNGTTDFRDVMRAFMCIFFAAMGAGQAAGMMGDISKATVAAHDAFKLLDRVSNINGMKELGPTPTDGDFKPGRIQLRDVHFHYPFRPDVKVLKGVSFSVEQNTSVGLCGPSGGGKSTIMALLQRYYDPAQGAISIGVSGTLLNGVNIRWWRQQVGFVGQEPILFNTTVRQNVLYGLAEGSTISEQQLETCRQMSHIDFLDKDGGKGWETEVGPRGAHLSGGQKQRVAICRALVRDPPVMLLDEATSALDSASEKVVQVALEEARRGRTSFAIAHRLSTISDCDVIMVIAEGVVLEEGTHAQLMEKQGVYCKLQSQSQK